MLRMRKVEDGFYQVSIASFDFDKDSAHEDDIRVIAAWLRVEAEARGVEVNIGRRLVGTPRQRNSFDCGVFVLMVIEHLSSDIGRALRVIEHGESMLDWFNQSDVTKRRKELFLAAKCPFPCKIPTIPSKRSTNEYEIIDD